MFRFASLLLLLVISSCPVAKEKAPLAIVRPAEVTIQTDQTEYVAQYDRTVGPQDIYGFTVSARFENRTEAPIYLARCYPDAPNPIYNVALDNGRGIYESVGYRTVQGCVGHDNHIIVQPGETRTDQLLIRGPNSWSDDSAVPKDALAGQFRLIYTAHFCPELIRCERPDAMQYSNVFTVRVK
jgi:hypothetical protein